MRQFGFNHQAKQWDRYNAFHVYHNPFVEFETGEVMVEGEPKFYDRRYYERYGIELTTTVETDRVLYLDKECTEAIPRAQLTQSGQQHMAIDDAEGVAVNIQGFGYTRSPKSSTLASHLVNAAALWTGPDRLPVPITRFAVSKPDRQLAKELSKLLPDVRAAVAAVIRMDQEKYHVYSPGERRQLAKARWLGMTVPEIIAELIPSGTINYSQKLALNYIASSGFKAPRALTFHDFLYVKPRRAA